MPQLQLPIFSEGMTLIKQKNWDSKQIPFVKQYRQENYISHKKKDQRTLNQPVAGTSKSDRSLEDSVAPIGIGATDTEGRLLASIFNSGPVEPTFNSCLDVPNGGVLLGLPGLMSTGVLRHTKKYFHLPNGYYGVESIFLLLGFMALARLKTIESLRYCSPGEWGKLLGLDRVSC